MSTHRFIAPVARVGVASGDGRILGEPGAGLLDDRATRGVFVPEPPPWSKQQAVGRITSAAILDGVLVLSGTLDRSPEGILAEWGLEARETFLSIAVSTPITIPEDADAFDTGGAVRIEGWQVQHALVMPWSGHPWPDLPGALVWED